MGKGALHPAKRKRRPQRKSPMYTPPEEEEYLSAAIQEASYTQLEAITNLESIKDALLSEGVVFVENVISNDLIDKFMREIDGFSGDYDSLVGLEDFTMYEGPPDLYCDWETIARKSIFKQLKKSIDVVMKNLFRNSKPIQNEFFIRCKGKGCSTVEHCDFFHYKSKIVSEIEEIDPIPVTNFDFV